MGVRENNMFDQQGYVNSYIKDNYKSIKLRVRKDDNEVLNRLYSVDNINAYILELIRKDVEENPIYRYINNDVKIDFPLSKTMKDLVEKAEEADRKGDYGLYMNMADAIDVQAKKEVSKHMLEEGQWRKLVRRYAL